MTQNTNFFFQSCVYVQLIIEFNNIFGKYHPLNPKNTYFFGGGYAVYKQIYSWMKYKQRDNQIDGQI